ncbi:MAG: hypothetical protein JW958_14800 [Candidatus Eisenbacteria bacterium]|nr:hypothetical protein [Candidatus Eisenbacteria bacterium]
MHLGFAQRAARWMVSAAAFLLLHPSGVFGSPYLLARQGSSGDCAGAERLVRSAGGAVLHRFPPRRLIIDLPSGREAALRESLGPEWDMRSGEAEETAGPAERIWNRVRSSDGAAAKGESPRMGRPLVGDALLPPALPEKAVGARGEYGPAGAGFWDGSEYMLGRVGVAVIFVESDGSVEPSTEDWTESEVDRIVAEIGRATDWWARWAPSGLLSFTYEFHTGVSVPYEPITHPQSEEALWIGGALESLGWGGGDRFTGTQKLLNDMRGRLDLDWAFAIYVIDSSEDPDGMFGDGVYFAYAYLGGPFLVLTLDNDGWGPENFAAVCAHEMGHIFYALDQYASARIPCDRTSGYLERETANSEYGSCPEEEPECIMRSRPLFRATLSATAIGQIGWADNDGDGIPDVIDTDPIVTEAYTEGGSGGRVAGTVSVSPLPNRNPYGYAHAISINTIEVVEARIDGGEWTPALPEDGEWGEAEEAFSLIPPDLAGTGRHGVEIRARNSAGNFSSATVLSWDGDGGGTTPQPQSEPPASLRVLCNRPNPFNPTTRVVFEAPAAGRGEAAVYNLRGALVRVLLNGDVGRGENTLEWDGRDERGREVPSGLYFCRILTGSESAVHPMTLLR